MEEVLIGINLPSVGSEPDYIRKKLSTIAEDGFNCVEISLDTVPLIINGEIKKDYVTFLKELLSEYHFIYTGHIGRGVDLRNLENFELQKKVLFSSIEVSSLLGINLLVLHYEQQSKDLLTEKMFLKVHEEASDFAATLGLTLCLENIEVERIDPVVDFVKKINRENFLLTFDTGHAYLSARYFHFNFLDSLREALPFLGHVHLSDNAGVFEKLRITDRPVYDSLPRGYRFTFARGDIHIPPFWGEIPFKDIFSLLREYRGIFICEYNSEDFIPFNKSVQQSVRAAVMEAR